MNTSTDLNADHQRQKILDAAHVRFLDYGFGKTTMAEIAEDASMSAANLYRYFKNKQEIAAACAERCMANQVEHLKQAVRQKHLSASQRLTTLALEAFRYNHNIMQYTPKVNELVGFVTYNKPELVQQKIKAHVNIIGEILAYGNETGEFFVDDVLITAEAINSTLLLFNVPSFLPLFSKEEFEAKAHQVVTLIIHGIHKR